MRRGSVRMQELLLQQQHRIGSGGRTRILQVKPIEEKDAEAEEEEGCSIAPQRPITTSLSLSLIQQQQQDGEQLLLTHGAVLDGRTKGDTYSDPLSFRQKKQDKLVLPRKKREMAVNRVERALFCSSFAVDPIFVVVYD